jgi:hypothetical protein
VKIIAAGHQNEIRLWPATDPRGGQVAHQVGENPARRSLPPAQLLGELGLGEESPGVIHASKVAVEQNPGLGNLQFLAERRDQSHELGELLIGEAALAAIADQTNADRFPIPFGRPLASDVGTGQLLEPPRRDEQFAIIQAVAIADDEVEPEPGKALRFVAPPRSCWACRPWSRCDG